MNPKLTHFRKSKETRCMTALRDYKIMTKLVIT